MKYIKMILDLEDMLTDEQIAFKLGKAIEASFFMVKVVIIEVNDADDSERATAGKDA